MSARGRLLAVGAGLALTGGLSACGDDNEDSASTATTRTATTRTATAAAAGRTAPQAQVPLADVAPQEPGQEGTPGVTGSDAFSGQGTVFRPFAANSPWNTVVDALPVDARSDELIRNAQLRLGAVEDQGSTSGTTSDGGAGPGGGGGTSTVTGTGTAEGVRTQRRRIDDPLFINTRAWTTPVVDSEGGEPTRLVCRQLNILPPPRGNCGDGFFVESLNIPAGQDPLPQYDGWYTVLDRQAGVAYDLWRARRARGANVLSYQFLRRWDLNGTGFLPPTYVSARGSGLPLFAGLLLPEEIQEGRVEHALAISVPGPAARRFVQPASVTDGNGTLDSLPEGARIRLKDSVRTSDLLRRRASPDGPFVGRRKRPAFPTRTNRRAAEAIVSALRRYGAIVVDRARVPTLYAKLNFNWQQPLRTDDGLLLDSSGRRPIARNLRRLPNQGTPLLRGNELQGLRLSDFEVVDLPPLLRDPPPDDTIEVTPLTGGATPQAVQTRRTPARTQTVAPTFRPGSTTGTAPATTGSTATAPGAPAATAPATTETTP